MPEVVRAIHHFLPWAQARSCLDSPHPFAGWVLSWLAYSWCMIIHDSWARSGRRRCVGGWVIATPKQRRLDSRVYTSWCTLLSLFHSAGKIHRIHGQQVFDKIYRSSAKPLNNMATRHWRSPPNMPREVWLVVFPSAMSWSVREKRTN